MFAIVFVAAVSFVKLWRGLLSIDERTLHAVGASASGSHSGGGGGGSGGIEVARSFIERAWREIDRGFRSAPTDDGRRRFLFVGGLQRSGTTVVSKLLGSIDFTSKLTMTQSQMAQNR